MLSSLKPFCVDDYSCVIFVLMAHLINPGGRFVEVTEEQFKEWNRLPGWEIPNDQEVQDWIKAKTIERDAMLAAAEIPGDVGVYLQTVSQGGKDGYAVASAQLINELLELDVRIQTHNTGQKIALLFHNPYSVLRLEAPYRIIYTMFESDKIPDDWREYLEAADKVLVPSQWCADVFKKAGIDAEVVPLGYNDKIFTYHERKPKRTKRQDFVFLHYNAFNIRKGFLEVFKAFNKAFTKDEPVKMIFKTTLDYMPLPITKAEYPNIEIRRGKFTDKQLLETIHESDCFVFPSRGEGFGITPLECMATGLPVIVPNAHGITEYFNKDFMYEAEVAETCPGIYSKYKNQDVGKMVICDVDQLAKQMRYVYEHQKEAAEMGKKASEYVKKWTFAETAKKLKTIFEAANKLNLNERPLKNQLNLELVR